MCRKTAQDQAMKHSGVVSADPSWRIRGFPAFSLWPYLSVSQTECSTPWWDTGCGCPKAACQARTIISGGFTTMAARGAGTGRWAPQLALPTLLNCTLSVQPKSGLWLHFGSEHRFGGCDLSPCGSVQQESKPGSSQSSCFSVCTPANKLTGSSTLYR